MTGDEHLRELEEKYEGYRVYDNAGERIGKVDDLFVDEDDREEYIGVKMGFFGMKSTLIPMDVARVNERDRVIEVAESKHRVKDAPSFEDDEDITPDFEERIRSHFGLTSAEGSSRGSYGGRSSGTETRAEEGSGTETRADEGSGRTARSERDEHGGLDRDAREDRELDVEGAPAGAPASATSGHSDERHEESREREGQEEYRNREDFSGSGTTDTAASGAPSDLETGDRGREQGSSGADDPYREGYEEGLREAGREAARREAESRGEGHSGSGESGATESTSERETASHSGGRHDDERRREGETSESTSTKVWRRIRS